MAITPPSNLAASAATPTKINLSWTNPQVYIAIEVQRSPNGSTGWGVIGTLGGTVTSWSDNSCQDGTRYYYRLEVTNSSEDSDYSNTANTYTPLPAPSGLSGSSTGGGTQVDLTWVDNAQNETAYVIYKNGSLLATIGANSTSYSAIGLTPGTNYSFYVKAYSSALGIHLYSPASNTLNILTADPPAAPSGLTAQATGTAKAQLNWTDNADNEIDFRIERSATSATTGFSEIATVSANVKTYEDASGLASNTQYWWRVRARNASGYSAYCTVATATTWAAIAQPTNLVAVAVSGTEIDIYFQDNSELEDGHSLEMKTGAGAYSEIVVLEPNRNAYRVTGLIKNTPYTFRVRAEQGGSSYSSYSTEVAVTTPTNASKPTDLAVVDYQDTWVELSWTLPSSCDRVNIGYSLDGVTYTTLGALADLTSYRVTGLTPNTLYYFRVQAVMSNLAGGNSDPITQTTRAAYIPTAFERLVRRQHPRLTYLVEVNPLIELTGWALSSGKTYTYEIPFDERGAVIEACYENGTALTAQTNIADVESNAGSWWHDTANKKFYIHPSGSDAPGNYTMTGAFWLYFTNRQRGDIVFNNHYYLPLLPVDGIPDVDQRVGRIYRGNFTIDAGGISLMNGKLSKVGGGVGRGNYFDSKFGRYLFLGRRIRALAGGPSFTYEQFAEISNGIITDHTLDDRRMQLVLRDLRDCLHRTLPIDRYSLDEFPAMDEQAVDRVKPFGYGAITNAVPVCIDTVNRVFEFHAGRIYSVSKVTQNGVELTANTDYFVDYQRGRIILARDLAYATSDIIKIDFSGATYQQSVQLQRPADILRDVLTRFLGLTDDDLNMADFVQLRNAITTAMGLYLWKEVDSQEIIRRIEQSAQAYTYQTDGSKLGIRAALTAAPSDIKYIPASHVLDFRMGLSRDDVYSRVEVYYSEDSSTDTWSMVAVDNLAAERLHGTKNTLPPIYTILTTSSDAQALATAVAGLLMKPTVDFTVTRCLFTIKAGDLVYFNRDRYYGAGGTASNKLLRVLAVKKQQAAGRTSITAEEI